MDHVERALAEISEMALGASTLREFETQWIEHLRPRVGFDTACSVWSSASGTVREVTSEGYSERALRVRFPSYMGELAASELARLAGAAPVVDVDVLGPSRRERLLVYRELLTPLGVTSFITQVWHAPWGVFGYHLGRVGPVRRFGDRETRLLRRLAPCVKLGQGLFARAPGTAPALSEVEPWTQVWALSPREVAVARLVARGLNNPEIAALLGISPNPLRNQLASVFRKADVSSRSELVFATGIAPEELAVRQKRRVHDAWRAFLARSGPR
jgi:DNA-binding CsgD family transcriptional regulator